MAETPTPEQIADHKAFLARITADYRAAIVKMVRPEYLLVVGDEIDGLVNAAQEEVRFVARVGGDAMTHPTDERQAVCARCGGGINDERHKPYPPFPPDAHHFLFVAPPTASAPPRYPWDGALKESEATTANIEMQPPAAVPPPSPAGAARGEEETYYPPIPSWTPAKVMAVAGRITDPIERDRFLRDAFDQRHEEIHSLRARLAESETRRTELSERVRYFLRDCDGESDSVIVTAYWEWREALRAALTPPEPT